MQESSSKVKLSKNILEMKFMKKSKEKCELEAEEEQRKALFDFEFAVSKDGDKCVVEPSYAPCQDLRFGRFSYKGMNPEIEKMMREAEQKDFAKYRRMDGISNREMALRYTTLVGSMERKFTSKRKWASEEGQNDDDDCHVTSYSFKQASQKNPYKFIKPQDDS